MSLKDNTKPWFITGAYPTQAQFYAFFDSIWFKDEGIGIENVTGLQTFINSIITLAQVAAKYAQLLALDTDGSVNSAAGNIITGMVIDAPGNWTINAGTTPGGTDIINALQPTTPDKPESITVTHYSKTAETIYFTGIPDGTKIIILKNSIS